MKRQIYRPLRITHGQFGYRQADSYEEKCRCVRARITELREKGYGGIVTNVAAKDYLDDDDEWRLMAEKAAVCKELGLRMWLYDEDGYPSGAAGTHTLDANPDYEARAAVMVSSWLAPGESFVQALPHGHEKLLAAVCYTVAGGAPTDEELLRPYARPAGDETGAVRFCNDTQTPMLCLTFYQKRMYEGAHCQHNVASCRRYLDVSNRDAVAEFINNTYRRYTAAVGQYYAVNIGDEGEDAVIEAIFTDEPSYMGCYLNAGLYPPHITHPYDDTIPLYPVVNWGRDFAGRFAACYGYSLVDNLTALFLGEGEAFCRVRLHFHQLMSELYEQAFFAQIGDYCGSVGLNFSGHLLLEDEMNLHVKYEGNFFKLLRHMHIPGIDMLQSTPQTVWDVAFTPRLVRSISELHGCGHVMDEVSAHMQGGKVTKEERYTALMLQLALGADVFTSYYSDEDPDGSMRSTLDALERAGQAIDGARLSDTLLLYPVETMMRHRRPPLDGSAVQLDHADAVRARAVMDACEKSMLEAQYACLDAQHSFTYTDTDTAALLAGAPAMPWRSFVIPACDVIPALAAAAAALAKAGCRIVWYAPAAAGGRFDAGLALLPAGTAVAATPRELLAALRPEGPVLTAAVPGEDTAGIACACTDRCTMLVNRFEKERALHWKGSPARVVDAATGCEVPLQADAAGVRFAMPGGAALLVYPK